MVVPYLGVVTVKSVMTKSAQFADRVFFLNRLWLIQYIFLCESCRFSGYKSGSVLLDISPTVLENLVAIDSYTNQGD